MREITAGDPGDLLIQRIEANAAGTGSGSGLGILTLMNDYGVRLTWDEQGARAAVERKHASPPARGHTSAAGTSYLARKRASDADLTRR